MTVQIMCSNCGHRSRKFAFDRFNFDRPPEKIVEAGWNSVGDAFYCRKCCDTWEDRNGKDRPLWGKAHTRERVYQVMIGGILDWLEYQEKGEWPM